jgi:spermidine synthase
MAARASAQRRPLTQDKRLPAGQRRSARGVTLSETDGVRYLHFGSVWVQGAMRVARPFALELEYQQQMMALGLLLPAPRLILQLGLGAAALTKFSWRHVPSARITAVELSEDVVRTARQSFRLPDDDARLQVVVDDARRHVETTSTRFDWLQVDLYDAAARGPVYDDAGFYRACRRVLATPGVAAFNLFGRSFEPSFAAIAAAFDDQVLVLPESDGGNRIALAYRGPRLKLGLRTLRTRADQLLRDWRLPAHQWLAGLHAENGLEDAIELH